MTKKSLEMLLLEKNRALQSEQTQLKVAHADLESKLATGKIANHESFLSVLSKTNTLPIDHIGPKIEPVISLSLSPPSLSAPPVHATYPTMITPTASLLSDLQMGNIFRLAFRSSFFTRPSIIVAGVTRKASISLDSLDTVHVSNVVRQLLAQHNIGQRVFARCVLNLSQGTVSELLSKPKPWSKLTEKGKESYRKMWTWAQSEESILRLKSISPRKGIVVAIVVSRVDAQWIFIRFQGARNTETADQHPCSDQSDRNDRSKSVAHSLFLHRIVSQCLTRWSITVLRSISSSVLRFSIVAHANNPTASFRAVSLSAMDDAHGANGSD